MESAKPKPIWKKKRPKNLKSTPLTAEEKERARERAAKAGRRYPNLIDNMAIARERNERSKLP